MRLFNQLMKQAVFELGGTLAEAVLRVPIFGDIVSMSMDIHRMNEGAYPVFVSGFSAPARWELKRNGIEVLGYNNNGVIWVKAGDGELADALLSRY